MTGSITGFSGNPENRCADDQHRNKAEDAATAVKAVSARMTVPIDCNKKRASAGRFPHHISMPPNSRCAQIAGHRYERSEPSGGQGQP